MGVIIDFGLVVLIWMVQLIIYPSFLYYQEQDLITWHKKYATAITIIVMPLMIGQVVFHLLSIIDSFNEMKCILLLMIVLTWAITFVGAVPLHNNITHGKEISQSIKSLIKVNWYRALLWTLVFCLHWFVA